MDRSFFTTSRSSIAVSNTTQETLTSAQESAVQKHFFSHTFEHGVDLREKTYMKVGGKAKLFTTVKTKKELAELCSFCFAHTIPFVILGGGSNVLISDTGIKKLVIANAAVDIRLSKISKNRYLLYTETGALVNNVVQQAVEQSLYGLSWFMGVPGTVGGAVYNNAHFDQQFIGEYITEVEVVKKNGSRGKYTNEQMQFAYDYSLLQKTKDIALSVTFDLKKGDKDQIQHELKNAVQKRALSQPLGVPSSGCMFKNVQKDGQLLYAGKLIDTAGLKGLQIGGAKVSEKHANFIVNTGGATAKDIKRLVKIVQKKVYDKFGVSLQREVFTLK